MDRRELLAKLTKYEMHFDSSEPAYLSAIRHAFASSRHNIPSPPSRPYFDPMHKREKHTERYVMPSHSPASVNGWIESCILFVATKTEARGRHKTYSLGGVLLIDDALVLEIFHCASAESDIHWEVQAIGIALGQLWRCLRSHGVYEPRTREVTLVCSATAIEWLSPGQGRKRAKVGQKMRRDWTAATAEAAKWTGLRWIESKGDDPLDLRAAKIAGLAMK